MHNPGNKLLSENGMNSIGKTNSQWGEEKKLTTKDGVYYPKIKFIKIVRAVKQNLQLKMVCSCRKEICKKRWCVVLDRKLVRKDGV